MGWTVNGYVPDEPKAKLVGGGGPGFKPPTNLERAISTRQDAARGGYQVPKHVPDYVEARPNQLHGPAKGNSAPMGLRDWQQTTGVYDAPVDRWRDTWTPTGFGVPGVPRGNIDGLQDFYGRDIGKNGVVDSIPVAPRDEVRTNSNGVVSAGKNLNPTSKPIDMNRSFNDLLATTNTSGYQPFSSNQLPTTAGSPDSNIGPVSDGVEYADMLQNAPGAGTVGVGPLADGDAYARAVEGKGKSTSRLDAALADTAGINSYMSKFSSGDQERAANRAFLDTEDSMLALRAKEAVNGVVYAQGKHYVSGKSGDDPAVGITRSAARDISNGRETSVGASQKAQDLLAKKKADVVAAVKQAPTELQSAASSQAFKQDKPMSATMPGDIGGSVEFNSNNDNVIEPFGNNGGYKSGFKRIDTTMNNPFG